MICGKNETTVVVVGAAFITSALPIRPAWIHPERGRDECCPYHHHGHHGRFIFLSRIPLRELICHQH